MVVELGGGGGIRNQYTFYTSPGINGPWTYQRSKIIKRLKDATNTEYNLGDAGVYSEGNTAWLLYTFDKPEPNYSQAILKLGPDFMTPLDPTIPGNYVEFHTGIWPSGVQEAAAIIKKGSTYYYFTSTCRGWNSSETRYRTAPSVAGPWTQNPLVATSPTSGNSFNTQHDFILPVVSTTGTSYIYCGDRWSNYRTNNAADDIGRYAWFPLTFNANGVPTINAPDYTTNGGDWMLETETPGLPATALQNPGFESDFASWTKTGNASIAVDAAEIHSGTKAFKAWSTAAYTTTLQNASATNCEAGTYTATVWSRAAGTFTQRVFEVYVNGTKTNELALPLGTAWKAYTIPGITVPAGATVKLGISLHAEARAWTQFDDFELKKN
jgi:hypothetical protein